MNKELRVVGYLRNQDGDKIDKYDMEIHEFYDYLSVKYIARGNKLALIPLKFVNELSRVEEAKKEQLDRVLKKYD